MHTKLIAPLVGIEVSSQEADSFSIMPDQKLVTRWSKLSRLVSPQVQRSIGTLNLNHIRQSRVTMLFHLEDIEGIDSEQRRKSVASMCMAQVRLFCEALWYVKDNSADAAEGFLIQETPTGLFVTSQWISHPALNCHGERSTVRFSRQELKAAKDLYLGRLLPWSMPTFTSKDAKYLASLKSEPKTRMVKGLPRLAHFDHFIQGARASQDLGLKISAYIQALEVLFPTHGEMTYKMAVRVSKFLAEDRKEREATYDFIKKAYQFRSQIVHGSTISKPALLAAYSEQLDDLCRNAFLKICDDPQLEEMFDLETSLLEAKLDQIVLS